MTDVHSKETRSYNMSQIKGKDTRPEIIVRKFLFKNGFRYRIHKKDLPGKPDIVMKKYKTIIFIHGCFWHGHKGCKYFIIPKTKTEWWTNKILKNHENDINNVQKLELSAWKVITVWECQLKPSIRNETLNKLINKIITS